MCAGAASRDDKSQLELHHLDYCGRAPRRRAHGRAASRHDDLVPLHPSCHELLHRLIDRDVVLSRHRTRRDATYLALERLRPQARSRSEESA